MTEERKKALKNLKTVRGQIDGIIKMIEEGRYCVDVSNQIMASYALLKRARFALMYLSPKFVIFSPFNYNIIIIPQSPLFFKMGKRKYPKIIFKNLLTKAHYCGRIHQ
jgi:hypothetical protein